MLTLKRLRKLKQVVNQQDGYPAMPMKSYKKYIKPYKVKQRVPGETSFIIEELMDRGIAKGDISQSDGLGTDNMTCIIVQFIDGSSIENSADLKSKDDLADPKSNSPIIDNGIFKKTE